MDYKSVIEEQIRELQKCQDRENCADSKIRLAATIADLCEKARNHAFSTGGAANVSVAFQGDVQGTISSAFDGKKDYLSIPT